MSDLPDSRLEEVKVAQAMGQRGAENKIAEIFQQEFKVSLLDYTDKAACALFEEAIKLMDDFSGFLHKIENLSVTDREQLIESLSVEDYRGAMLSLKASE